MGAAQAARRIKAFARGGKQSPGAVAWRGNLSPMATVGHRDPWLSRRQRAALLQQLDRNPFRRADKGHVAVARRSADGNAAVHQPLARLVDVLHLIGQMAEIAAALIVLGIPVVRDLDHRRAPLLCRSDVIWRRQEHQREAAGRIVEA